MSLPHLRTLAVLIRPHYYFAVPRIPATHLAAPSSIGKNKTNRLFYPKLDHVLRRNPSFLSKVQGRVRWEEYYHPSRNHAAKVQYKLSQLVEQALVRLLCMFEFQEGTCWAFGNT